MRPAVSVWWASHPHGRVLLVGCPRAIERSRSIGVLFSSCIMHFKGWMVMDPLVTIFIAAVIAQSAFPLLKASGRILLQSTPSTLKPTLQKIMREVTFGGRRPPLPP